MSYPTCKIIIIGEMSVGKTSLVKRFDDKGFTFSTKATIGVDFVKKEMTVKGNKLHLQVWDTAGQEKYRSITRQFYAGADGLIIVYDCTSPVTFSRLRDWLQSIHEHAPPDIPVILVANKADSDGGPPAVSHEEGQKYAEENNWMFRAASAKDGTNVNEVFEDIAGKAYEFVKPADFSPFSGGLASPTKGQDETVDVQKAEPTKKKGCCK